MATKTMAYYNMGEVGEVFSALHDKGYRDQQLHCGITYFEGTAIWEANENAVNSIFPHDPICRRHVVFQKRLKIN